MVSTVHTGFAVAIVEMNGSCEDGASDTAVRYLAVVKTDHISTGIAPAGS